MFLLFFILFIKISYTNPKCLPMLIVFNVKNVPYLLADNGSVWNLRKQSNNQQQFCMLILVVHKLHRL